MNVLMFGWEFPPNISGGLGTACQGIVKGLLACRGINIKFVVPKAFGNERSENIELISANDFPIGKKIYSEYTREAFSKLKVPSALSPYLNPETFSEQIKTSAKQHSGNRSDENQIRISFSGKYGNNLFDEINNYAIVAKSIAHANKFDLIHAHDWLTFPAAIAAKNESGKPLIVHIHSTDFDRSGGSVNPAIYDIEKQGLDAADQIIAVSNRIKDRLINDYGIQTEKITTIYNAIDPLQGKPKRTKNKKTKVVTFLGRITIQKGPAYFAEVARLILKHMENVNFVMAGTGEMRDQIIECCAAHGISDRFHFTGFLNSREVEEVLGRSDVFIMPSVSEPFGLVPLEAMQFNVPTIISVQSGVSELIRNAVKTDFWDTHAMADAVHAILKYKRFANIISHEASKEVNRLNWKNSAAEIKQLYMDTLSRLAS